MFRFCFCLVSSLVSCSVILSGLCFGSGFGGGCWVLVCPGVVWCVVPLLGGVAFIRPVPLGVFGLPFFAVFSVYYSWT